MSTLSDVDSDIANGGRVIDIGGLDKDCEEDLEGGNERNLVILALDPGETTGWSALKVPTGRLVKHGATRTLSRCRWRHGQILRSMAGVADGGPLALSVSDSRHVDLIFQVMHGVYEEMVFVADEEDEEEGWEDDVFVLVVEHFKLRMMSMDDNLLAPVRVENKLLDRLYSGKSTLPIFFQSPSEAMSTVTDTRLKDWAMYDRNSGPHARDADRHAILFLRRFTSDRRIRQALGFDW
jgi:hypothetical protein